jgi:hypothetical protein
MHWASLPSVVFARHPLEARAGVSVTLCMGPSGAHVLSRLLCELFWVAQLQLRAGSWGTENKRAVVRTMSALGLKGAHAGGIKGMPCRLRNAWPHLWGASREQFR